MMPRPPGRPELGTLPDVRRLFSMVTVLLALTATGCGDGDSADRAGDAGGSSDEFADDFSSAEELSEEVCDPFLVGDDEGPVTSIYAVEDGILAGLCWGDPDEAVTGAFELLEAVTPRSHLRDLHYVGGFDGGASTLAFIAPVDDDYSGFVMAIDIVSAVDDPGELRLTVLHEFAHVFTQRNDQLDLAVDPDSCATLWNGAGCFVPGSYVDDWINRFWSDEELRSLPFNAVDEDAGVERCAVDPGFLGSYAASGPEEDFAETYSAFVFDLDVPVGVVPRIQFFEEYPELAEARDRARESGIGPVPNPFDRCG